MSKSVSICFILTLFIALTSVSGRPHSKGRDRKTNGGHWEIKVQTAAEDPKTEDNDALIDDLLAAAQRAEDMIRHAEEMMPNESLTAYMILKDVLVQASEVVKKQPQAEMVQPEVIMAQVEEAHRSLTKHLKKSKKIQRTLTKHAVELSVKEAIELHKDLQHHMMLALHFAEKHNVAVQQTKIIDFGATPDEVNQMATVLHG